MYPLFETTLLSAQEIKYFCEVNKNLQITVYKGGYSGDVIATAIQCREKGGVTKIKMTGSNQALHLKHGSGMFSNKTFFQIDGKRVHWKGESELVEEKTGSCLAVYKEDGFESKNRKLGTLLVTAYGVNCIDAIVCSAFVKQERTDEDEYEVQLFIDDPLTCIEIRVLEAKCWSGFLYVLIIV
jgi:hypothetical protein